MRVLYFTYIQLTGFRRARRNSFSTPTVPNPPIQALALWTNKKNVNHKSYGNRLRMPSKLEIMTRPQEKNPELKISNEQRLHGAPIRVSTGGPGYSEEFKAVLAAQRKAKKIWIG